MFLLLLLLTALGQLHAGLNSHKTILHTTIPEKISSSDNKMEAENNIAYIIKIEGRQYLIHLKKQSFLSLASVVSSYDKKDTLHSKSLIVQMDCNYQGYVAGFPNSLVTLNTCSGLRGILQFQNISYGIEPMEAISGFVHMIYEEKNDNINVPLLRDSDISAWSNDLQSKARKSSKRTEFSNLSPRYIEMHIVVDKNLFDYMGSDIKVVTQKVILIVGLVNAMLAQLKLTVIISSIEIWSNKNQFSTTGQPSDLLIRLVEWEGKYLVPQPHHNTYFFVFRKYPSFIGTTFPGKMCYKTYAKGVALYSDGLSLESFAVIIVQLLGLQLGLTYDSSTDACLCSGDVCIMTPKAFHVGGVKDFSTCSLDDFKYIVSQSDLKCLQNRTVDIPVYKAPTRICGNGMLEPGEQCDCGTSKNCTHKRCCDPRTCSLKKGMVCGSGNCCTKDCKIKPRGTLCRKSADEECDFNEYCNGDESICVPDTYVHDGYFCDSGDGFCYKGRCRTFDKQCKSAIGGASTGAPFDCFEDINGRHDRYGNCGGHHCNFPDILCGKLVCSWPHKRLILRTNLSVFYTHRRDEICVVTYRGDGIIATSVRSPEDRDVTYVEDGTPCGPEMFCIRFECKETRFFMDLHDCDATRDCNKSGICNNFNHCHCNKGFVPPSCKAMKGQFGSVDDGHQFPEARSSIQKRYATSPKHQLLLIGYVCLPVLIILTAILIMQNKLREFFYGEETEDERSVTEESSSSSKLSLSSSQAWVGAPGAANSGVGVTSELGPGGVPKSCSPQLPAPASFPSFSGAVIECPEPSGLELLSRCPQGPQACGEVPPPTARRGPVARFRPQRPPAKDRPAGHAMLSLLLLLSGLGRLAYADQNSEKPLLQITVPQKIWTTDRNDDTSKMHIAYVIKIDEKIYTFHLEKQSFLDPHFLVYSYNKSGALQSRSSFLKDHCFYRGYAAEVLNSVATLNTCSGLRGLLQLENVSYGIEPLQSAGTYEHMLYQIRNKKIDFFPSQGNYLMKPPEDQVNRILVKSEKNPDAILLKRNLKVQIILDKALYDYMGSDVAIAEEKVVQMFGLINTMFSQLKVTVRLSSLELWSDKNKISTNGDPNDILQRFLAWKEAYLVQRPHDMAYLLIYRDYPNYVGATYHGVACNPKLAAGIALYPKLITLEAFSVVMTQLLGINLGLTYDAIYKCYCPGSTCIMNPDSIHSHGVKFFSSCSLDEFKHVVTQPEFECLQNQIISKVAFQGRQSHSTCGNGRLEPPEECDCGSAEACEYKKCCNPLDCTLLESAECGTGPCCNPKTCQVTEHGEVCRESVDPCDLIEYCNGTSELCGPDMNTLNFEQCLNETAFCYNGLCRSMDRQCFEVFGKFARGADYLCLQEVNSHADDFGRCIGRTCTYEGILCGKIVCHWTTTDLVTMADYDVQYTYVAGRVCVSAAVTEAAFWSIFDNTFVEMGTICGSDKFCARGICKSVSNDLEERSCGRYRTCNGHGVCNTNHHCQCEAGYAPPNCVPAPSSQGGSIDDGFWQWGDQSVPLVVRRRAAPQNKGLLISFYIFLPLLIITAIITLRWNKMNGFWNRGSERFISEDSNSNSSLTQSSN